MRLFVGFVVIALALGQTPAPTIQSECGNGFFLNMTIRDFAAAASEGQGRHPDFEIYNKFHFKDLKSNEPLAPGWDPRYDNQGTKGIVTNRLVNGRPEYNTTTACPSGGMPWGTRCAPRPYDDMVVNASTFEQWYTDGPWVLGKTTIPIFMRLIPGSDPPKYDFTAPDDPGFFPLDNIFPASRKIPNSDNNAEHNYGFTTEIRADFTYQSGSTLFFEGDDDVWIYVEGQLVLDLGGMHAKQSGTVDLGTIEVNGEKLKDGAKYSMAMFHAERHTDESNFKFQSLCLTSTFFIATDEPTPAPTTPQPTEQPTDQPTPAPSLSPTTTRDPTMKPTDSPTKTPSVAPTFGDPHLVTLDGLRYTFNGVGDYYLAMSDSYDIEVQMRTHVVSNTSAAVTGVAMRYADTSVAAVWSGQNSEEIRLTINGRLIGNDKPAFEDPAVMARTTNGSYEVTLLGPQLKMHLFYNGRSSFEIEMPALFQGHLRGLLGNFNGEPRDDLTSAGGVRVPIVSSNRHIHYAFGRTWEVSPRMSLFRTFDRVHRVPYGKQFESTFEPLFDTAFKSREFEGQARRVCGDDAQCLYDAAATKDLQYAALTKLDNARGASRLSSLVDAGSTVQSVFKVDL